MVYVNLPIATDLNYMRGILKQTRYTSHEPLTFELIVLAPSIRSIQSKPVVKYNNAQMHKTWHNRD